MRNWIFGLAPVLLTAQLAFGMVKTDYDHQARFSDYKSFAWKAAPGGNGRVNNAIVEGRIEQAVGQQLTQKGMREDRLHPDVYLVYNINAMPQRVFEYYPGPGW